MLSKSEIESILHEARMDNIQHRTKTSLLKSVFFIFITYRYMKAMNEIEFHKEQCSGAELEEWVRLQKDVVEEYNATRENAQDIEMYTDQLNTNQSWASYAMSGIGMHCT